MQDINQLKLILEAVGQTTESAKWVLFSWLAADLVKEIIAWIGAIISIVIFTRCVILLVGNHMFGKYCRDLVVPGEVGTHISDSERKLVIETIQAGIQARKKDS